MQEYIDKIFVTKYIFSLPIFRISEKLLNNNFKLSFLRMDEDKHDEVVWI